jgi:hypothetical protein
MMASLLVALVVHGGSPTSVDEMAQLLHARAIASGRLTIPLQGNPAAWVIQNGVSGPAGWVSIYPPFHTILLSLGVLIGAPWVVGPLATGVATGATTWTAERLLGAPAGRAAGFLLLASPFWILVGGTHLSHTTAAAALAMLAVAALQARDGHAAWALLAGASMGAAVTSRPWVGLVCGAAILIALWGETYLDERTTPLSAGPTVRRAAALVAGGAPFALLLSWWNARLFGHPLRLGYTAAFGPAHGLGLHVDPWGNRYGLIEAVAYTGADLAQLGVRLFESPLPAIAVLGLAALVTSAPKGARLFVAWIVTGLCANALYWHHGIHFGPRMLFETVPAWVAVFGLVVARAFAEPAARGGARVVRWTLGVAIVGGLVLAPSAYLGQARPALTTPTVPADDAVIFAHGSWASRVSARLAGAGMRRDSIETALRRNDLCAVDRYVRWRISGVAAGDPPLVDFESTPGSPPDLETRELSPGNLIRVDPRATPDASCLREARADRLGVLELELFAWRLPPFTEAPAMIARDLGPAANLSVLEATGRQGYVYMEGGAEAGPVLLGYAEGMELLWGGAAASAILPEQR